jgi:ribosomal protein L21E
MIRELLRIPKQSFKKTFKNFSKNKKRKKTRKNTNKRTKIKNKKKLNKIILRGGDFSKGDIVIINELISRPELNGKPGTIIRYSKSSKRYRVKIEGEKKEIYLLPEKLTLSVSAPTPSPSPSPAPAPAPSPAPAPAPAPAPVHLPQVAATQSTRRTQTSGIVNADVKIITADSSHLNKYFYIPENVYIITITEIGSPCFYPADPDSGYHPGKDIIAQHYLEHKACIFPNNDTVSREITGEGQQLLTALNQFSETHPDTSDISFKLHTPGQRFYDMLLDFDRRDKGETACIDYFYRNSSQPKKEKQPPNPGGSPILLKNNIIDKYGKGLYILFTCRTIAIGDEEEMKRVENMSNEASPRFYKQ